jgi:hypothetical protein
MAVLLQLGHLLSCLLTNRSAALNVSAKEIWDRQMRLRSVSRPDVGSGSASRQRCPARIWAMS